MYGLSKSDITYYAKNLFSLVTPTAFRTRPSHADYGPFLGRKPLPAPARDARAARALRAFFRELPLALYVHLPGSGVSIRKVWLP